MWLLSPRRVIENLLIGHEAPAAALTQGRSVNVPASRDGRRHGRRVAARGRRRGGCAVHFAPDPAIQRIVQTWPRDFDPAYGRSLGMRADADFDAIVRQYIDDELCA